MSGQEKQLYEFGPFRLDPVKRCLLREGEPVPLTPKAFETLLVLVKQSGKTVEKDDMMRRIWPDAVVEENNLNQNITALRKCLGDSRQASQYIATIPGLGYRFVAEVKTASVAEAETAEDLRGQVPLAVEKSGRLGEDRQAEIANTAASGAESAAPDNFKVPAWSPDGKVIACSAGGRERYDFHNSVVAVRVEDGGQSPASPREWGWTGHVEWLADGSGLLLTASEQPEGMDQIWHVSYPEGAARRITSDSNRYRTISLILDSRTLVAVLSEFHSDIWVAPEADAARAQKITFGTGAYLDVCYTPDGRIVYASQAGGNWDIWVMNADGGGQQQLTAEAGVNAHPHVSPDGRHIVFASNRAGVFNIWRMESDGGNPVRLTAGGGEKFPQWSPDGGWVVYTSVSPDESLYSLWKVSSDGGEPVQLTATDCERPAVSPDGKRVAGFHRDTSAAGGYSVVVTPFDGGPPERTFAIPQDVVSLPFVRWSPDGQWLTYTAHRDGIQNIWMQPLRGGPAKQLTEFKSEGRLRFDWSRDGKQLVLSRHVWTSDLVLLRNFSPGKT